MNKFTCPKIDEKYVKYGIQVMTKSNECCWVTFFEGVTIGTEKGMAILTDKANADYCAFRLHANGIIAFTCRIPDGIKFANERDFLAKEYSYWIGD